MRIRVLGSAAGGGFPQWNCGCANCRDARRGVAGLRARSQESVAVSADGDDWFLLNASPEIRAQIESFEPLHPRAPRQSPIAGLVLTNGDLDHCLGLLSLRESHPLHVYATAAVQAGWTDGNLLHRTLQRFEKQLTWCRLSLGVSRPLLGQAGQPSGLEIQAMAVAGKLPIHLEGQRAPSPEDNVGLLLHEPARGQTLAYFPAVAALPPGLEQAIAGAGCLFFDGTFWSSDELGVQGLGEKRAEDMAHWPVGGERGSLPFLARLPGRRVYIHINNTNPMLRDDSVEASRVRAASVEIAHDGMEIVL
jgi:pyrroloquinoline quinone biosynthesis protein B